MAPAASLQEKFSDAFYVHSQSPTLGLRTPDLKAMDKLAEREIKASCLLDHGGLMPLPTGALRMRLPVTWKYR